MRIIRWIDEWITSYFLLSIDAISYIYIYDVSRKKTWLHIVQGSNWIFCWPYYSFRHKTPTGTISYEWVTSTSSLSMVPRGIILLDFGWTALQFSYDISNIHSINFYPVKIYHYEWMTREWIFVHRNKYCWAKKKSPQKLSSSHSCF